MARKPRAEMIEETRAKLIDAARERSPTTATPAPRWTN